jgi:dTDP-4-amino-4,6-dideoxygalactose transaminase
MNDRNPSSDPISLIDLKAQQNAIRSNIDQAIARVLDHGNYIMGAEVGKLETELAQFSGAKHVVSCSNGTDALMMVLMAKGIGPGDAVVCPAFTFTATPEVIAVLGATPIFVDVDENSFNLDVSQLSKAADVARRLNLKLRAVMAVDLFGQPADYSAIETWAMENDVWVLADAAQSFGASVNERRVGTFGLATTTSFFPAKPLGCYGDGGAIFTDDDELADTLQSIRVHGKGSDKYDNVRVGLNGRLDTLQAAILIEKLRIFPQEIVARQVVAERYGKALCGCVSVPHLQRGHSSVWAQYTIRVPSGKRDPLAAHLKTAGIPTAIYYPKPLHFQTAYRSAPIAGNGLPVSEALPSEVLSLPMHPYLSEDVQYRIIRSITDFFA